MKKYFENERNDRKKVMGVSSVEVLKIERFNCTKINCLPFNQLFIFYRI